MPSFFLQLGQDHPTIECNFAPANHKPIQASKQPTKPMRCCQREESRDIGRAATEPSPLS